MIALLVALALGQSPCANNAALMTSARERAALFDLRGAMASLAADPTCDETSVAYWYLKGLLAAREAYRFGGSPESLEPVRVAVAELAARRQDNAVAEIARVVLLAAAAGAQSERDEMGLFLEHALDLERQQRSAGLTGAPIVTAHEVAGDLWLQVHRFEDARRAYLDATTQIGATRRVTLGLARTAARVGDSPTSCEQYRNLVNGWPQWGGEPPELIEARTFLRRPDCRAPGARSPR